MKNRASVAPAMEGCNLIGTLADLADMPRWVAWCTEERNGKPTKVPYNPVSGGRAKADDPTTWGTRAQAEARAKRLGGAVGVQLGPINSDYALGGIDLDSCRDTLGELEPWAGEAIDRFASYAETSPSGNGIKVLFLYMLADLPALHAHMGDAKYRKAFTRGTHHEIALDLGNRYYAITDLDIAPGADVIGPTPLRLVPRDDLVWLLAEAGPAFAPQAAAADRDESGSGHGYRFLVERAHSGANKADAMAALKSDAGPAGAWARRSDERQLNRAWSRAVECAQEQRFNAESKFEEQDGDPGEPGEHIEGFPLTEDGVARVFAKQYADQLRFCHSTGRWFQWTGARWQREETQLAFEWARETCRARAETAGGKSAAAKAMAKASTASAVEKFARADRAFAVTAEVWDQDIWLLGTPSGTVDLRKGTIRPAEPGDMITRLTAVAPIPLDSFDADRDCPRWLAFLRQATGNDIEAIRFLQQWAGYSLTGDTSEEALLFVHGPGGSGKSTAINTLGDLMGDYCVNVATEALTASKFDRHPTELARLKGARLARASETEAGRAWAESRIKALTGGDVITARFMRCDEFEYRPTFKLTIVGNHAPRIVNVDGAMRRRFNILPFNHPPALIDSGLKEALKAEWPGILSWALQGCLDWRKTRLVRPSVVHEATATYFSEQDTFALWLEEACELGRDNAETSDALWESWQRFATTAGEPAGSKTKEFPERLKAKGFDPVRDTAGIRGRGFKGLRLAVPSAFDDGGDDDDLV